MINYADYNFYEKTYKGSLSDSLFNSLIPKASREIDKAVNKELEEVDITDKVKYVACELVDFLNANEDSMNGNKVSSISIDGVSKNYVTKSKEEIKAEERDILNGLPLDLIRFI